jgi:FkbM family methyltransferase
VALEPSLPARLRLLDNIAINHIDHLVKPLSIGAGSKKETLGFSQDAGTTNHVVSDGGGMRIDVQPLDDVFLDETPNLLKVDVEGFEPAVITGSSRILQDEKLNAVIIEDVGLSAQYQFESASVHDRLTGYGFGTYHYDVDQRSLHPTTRNLNGNSIYIRNIELARECVKHGKAFSVLGRSF